MVGEQSKRMVNKLLLNQSLIMEMTRPYMLTEKPKNTPYFLIATLMAVLIRQTRMCIMERSMALWLISELKVILLVVDILIVVVLEKLSHRKRLLKRLRIIRFMQNELQTLIR